jgi:hypothetical protein
MNDTGLVEASSDVLATTPHPLQTTYEPPHVTYGPGAGLSVGLAGIGCVAVSLFGLDWVNARNGMFVELSRQARDLGSAHLGTMAYIYLAWAAFGVLALTGAFVVVAGIPVPRTAAGNTFPRVLGAIVASSAAAFQTYVVVHTFPMAVVAPGAWVGVAGYLLVVAGFVLGARRRVR